MKRCSPGSSFAAAIEVVFCCGSSFAAAVFSGTSKNMPACMHACRQFSLATAAKLLWTMLVCAVLASTALSSLNVHSSFAAVVRAVLLQHQAACSSCITSPCCWLHSLRLAGTAYFLLYSMMPADFYLCIVRTAIVRAKRARCMQAGSSRSASEASTALLCSIVTVDLALNVHCNCRPKLRC